VVTARKQVGAQSTYSALRNWQPPRPSYDQLRQPSQPTPGDLEVLLRTTEVARRLQVSASQPKRAGPRAGPLPLP
jgi:hypothetical protein